MLNLIASVFAFVTGAAFCVMGIDWITLGYGLNPYIAFPMASVFFALSLHQVIVGVEEIRLANEYRSSLKYVQFK